MFQRRSRNGLILFKQFLYCTFSFEIRKVINFDFFFYPKRIE